jgi:hypothetical protein
MRPNKKEEGNKKKVIIITMKMSCKQIMNKLILSSVYAMSDRNSIWSVLTLICRFRVCEYWL